MDAAHSPSSRRHRSSPRPKRASRPRLSRSEKEQRKKMIMAVIFVMIAAVGLVVLLTTVRLDFGPETPEERAKKQELMEALGG